MYQTNNDQARLCLGQRLNAISPASRLTKSNLEQTVVEAIEHDDSFVMRAVIFLWDQQTPGEKASKMTIEKNHVGVSASDARVFAKMMRHLEMDGRLSPEDFHWCRGRRRDGTPRLARYRKQLIHLLPLNDTEKAPPAGRLPQSAVQRTNVGGKLNAA
jgi:hypothetical protein